MAPITDDPADIDQLTPAIRKSTQWYTVHGFMELDNTAMVTVSHGSIFYFHIYGYLTIQNKGTTRERRLPDTLLAWIYCERVLNFCSHSLPLNFIHKLLFACMDTLEEGIRFNLVCSSFGRSLSALCSDSMAGRYCLREIRDTARFTWACKEKQT